MVGKTSADKRVDVSPSADLLKKTKAKRRTGKDIAKNPVAWNGQHAGDDEIDDLFDKLKAYPKKKQKSEEQGQGKGEVGCFALFDCFFASQLSLFKARHPYL